MTEIIRMLAAETDAALPDLITAVKTCDRNAQACSAAGLWSVQTDLASPPLKGSKKASATNKTIPDL
ncbi:hypothetical protein [Ruminococcus sp.]|uniref:hypothetical protein n=1 Tax=Ruminococcus sp. TaxID=41978 RepID=UPI0025F8EEA9|nr:hypothetical protein [Ruminococcus sp.]MBQ8965931.1 hypothetical protein [Ruminococcus sp.]